MKQKNKHRISGSTIEIYKRLWFHLLTNAFLFHAESPV